MAGTDVAIESPLPAALAADRGTALFLAGAGAPREILVDGEAQPAVAIGGRWWATVRVGARPAGAQVVLSAGGRALARLPVAALEGTGTPGGELIAVCMATYEPDPELFAAQVDSIRAQTDERWICVVSDDGSGPEGLAEIGRVLDGDPRFVLHRSDVRRGFYRNFERALALAPPEAGLIALSDHDDRWYPEKLAALRAELGGAGLVYSDQRLVTRDGRLLRDSLWVGRRNDHADIASMLVAGSVTGASALMRREVADAARPFPDTPGIGFHDHWLALVALATGDVAYVDRPLYDYVQHPGAVFGEVSSGAPGPVRRRDGRAAYFIGYLDKEVAAQALLARFGGGMAPPKRRALERYVAAQRSPLALARLVWAAVTHRHQTLGSELELASGVLWRHAAALRSRLPGPRPDVGFPDPMSFQQQRLRRWRARL